MAEATVDTSIYPKAPQTNLLEIYGNAQNLANAQQQNQLLHTANQQAQVGLSQSKIDLAHQQFGQLSQFLGSLAQDPRIGTPQGHDVLLNATQQAVKQGWITPDIAQQEIQNMPADPTQIPQYLQNLNTRVQDAAGQFRQIYGDYTPINNGNKIIPTATSPITGQRRIGADIPIQTSPSERNQLVPTVGQKGQTVMQTQGGIVSQAGQNPLTGMPLQQPAPTAQQQMFNPNQTVPQTGQQQPGGGVVTSPPAGEVEAMQHQATASTDHYSSDQQREANFQNDVLPLTKSIAELQSLGTTGTGPGTETLNDWKSFAQSMGVGSLAGIDPDKITSYDEARKYLTAYASSIGGSGTNDKLAAAFAGNPSTNISNAAAINVAKTALSMRRLQNAQVRSFSASGASPSGYNQYAAQFNASQDPVAYGVDQMDGAARKKYFQGLSAPEKTKFLESLKTATKLGVITPPSINNGAPNGGQ